jgi:uncharacterized protein (DUF1684 family)
MSRAWALCAVILLAACSSRPPDEGTYLRKVAADRAAKDAAFRGRALPIPVEAHGRFLPLAYFPIDPAFAVPASFTEDPPAARPRMQMQTSAHQPREMERLGTLNFVLQGRLLHLAAFREVGEAADVLFVPFTDETTGQQTYAAGRYLEIARSPSGVYVVDFNTAFNPYCYYNSTYDCPFPPKENRLPVAIRAGERTK